MNSRVRRGRLAESAGDLRPENPHRAWRAPAARRRRDTPGIASRARPRVSAGRSSTSAGGRALRRSSRSGPGDAGRVVERSPRLDYCAQCPSGQTPEQSEDARGVSSACARETEGRGEMSYFVNRRDRFHRPQPGRAAARARGDDLRAGARGLARSGLTSWRSGWGADEGRIVPVIGDLSQEKLGCAETIDELRGKIDHFFHLAAIYDMTARRREPAGGQRRGDPRRGRAGRRARAPKRFHHGQLDRRARASTRAPSPRTCSTRPRSRLNHPTSRPSTSPRRSSARSPRCRGASTGPAIVVGDSRDRRDGQDRRPLLLLQAAPDGCGTPLPQWFAGVGIEGGEINIVPVDFVAGAMDHIAHQRRARRPRPSTSQTRSR